MDNVKMRGHVEAWHRSMAANPRTADMRLAVLSRLLSFGVARELLAHNRALGIRRIYKSARVRSIWTSEEIDKFCEAATPELTWAVRLAYATGQRQGDLLSLTWNDVSDEGVTFRTSKTGVRLFVPMYDELREALAGIPRRSIQVLTAPAGRPWTADNFRHEFRRACSAADVGAGLHFHDLRGSALKAFADAGASELELRAISGHAMSSLSGALSSYIDAFRSLAEAAVRKRENAHRTSFANRGCKPRNSGGTA
ncbi:MAG TPA: tyrosine-type recombinase/integrase [Phenylobacterium sp.]